MLQPCDTNAIRLAARGSRLGAVNINRNVGTAVAACAAALSLAACSAGITSAPAATTAATSSSSPSRSATAAASPSSAAGRILEVSGVPGGFPVPSAAKVAENVSTSSGIGIMFSKVTPDKVQSFYAQALPRAGWRITGDQSFSGSSGMMIMQFTGHGFKGTVSTMATVDPSDTLPGLGTKNVTSVLLDPK